MVAPAIPIEYRSLKLAPADLLPVQQEIALLPDDSVAHLAGSYRGGKTAGAILRLMLHTILRHESDYIIAAISRDAAVRNIGQYIYKIGLYLGVAVKRVGWAWRVGTCWWRIFGANDLRAPGRLAGMTAAGALIDEIVEMTPEFYFMVHSRCSLPGRIILTTCNPAGPYHWVKTDLIDRVAQTGDIDLEAAHAAIRTNQYLPPGFLAGLEATAPAAPEGAGP